MLNFLRFHRQNDDEDEYEDDYEDDAADAEETDEELNNEYEYDDDEIDNADFSQKYVGVKKWLVGAIAAAALGAACVTGYSIFSSTAATGPAASTKKEQQISTIWSSVQNEKNEKKTTQQSPALPGQIPGQLPPAAITSPAALPQQPARQPTLPSAPAAAFIPPPSLPASGNWQSQFAVNQAAQNAALQAQLAQQKAEEDARKSKIMLYAASQTSTATAPAEAPGRVLHAGTVIPAVLMQAISSDAPGVVTAMVAQDVFDSITGNYMIIPAGSRLIGKYDTDLAYAQERLKIDFERIILPDGRQVNLTSYGADAAGAAGFKDKVNHHTNRTVNAAILSAIVSAATAAATGQAGDAAQAAAAGATEAITNTMTKVIEKNLNIRPTITIRPGYRLNAVLAKDITL